MKRLLHILAGLGPGIFAVGYTVGTGSVTSMAKAGAESGFGYLWVLALSCIFSFALMTAYGRYAAVTGETSLHGMARQLPCGRLVAALVFIGVVTGQWACLGGIMALTSGAIKEAFGFNAGILPIAAVVMALMFALTLLGRLSLFEKTLAVLVALMVFAFAVSALVVWPDTETLRRAATPVLPTNGASLLMFAAFVGTTMAAPTFVTRPLFVRDKGWGAGDIARERTDAAVSATVMFIVSAAVVAVATGALFAHGKTVDRVLDMAATLEPVAGRHAVAFFMVGVLAAGLSSVFPIMMVAPLLIGDWRSGEVRTRTPLFRALCLVAALAGLVVPALGANPVAITVAAQVSNVFVLPLTVAAILWLVNSKAMGAHRAGRLMNAALCAALVFSVCVAVAGAKSLKGFF